MRIHRQHGLPEPPAGQADQPTGALTGASARRLRWRARRRRDRGNAGQAPSSEPGGDQTPQAQTPQAQTPQAHTPQAHTPQAAPGETMAAAMQLAIALLTAGLDSPEL